MKNTNQRNPKSKEKECVVCEERERERGKQREGNSLPATVSSAAMEERVNARNRWVEESVVVAVGCGSLREKERERERSQKR